MTLRIGAHVSIAGGFENAILEALEIKANCGQIFSHSPRMIKNSAIPAGKEENIKQFREGAKNNDIGPWYAHCNYLINMGSSDEKYWKVCVDTMKIELENAAKLGLEGIIVHPGSNKNREEGLKNINLALKALEKIEPQIWLLIENTAGAGDSLGGTFDNIETMFKGVKRKNLGMCMDTCHTFAAGYDISKKEGLKSTLEIIDQKIGLDRLRAIHLNDSQGPLDGHLDRHEHIGMGQIGEAGMKNILTNNVLKKLPFFLETNIDKRRGHKENIAEARRLAGK